MGLVVSLVRQGRLFPQGAGRERRGQGPLFPWSLSCKAALCFQVVRLRLTNRQLS